MTFKATLRRHPTGLNLLLLVQSAAATVTITSPPVIFSLATVKIASTWGRSLCPQPSGGFCPY